MADGHGSADIAAWTTRGTFWDSEYKGVTGLYDEYRETLERRDAGSGITDINGAASSDLKSQDNLIELPDLVDIRYTIDGAYSKLPEGVFGIHHAWSGDMLLRDTVRA